jgi:calcineurin-like phosphoesterase family protein
MADYAGNFPLRTEFSPCAQGGGGYVRAQRAMPRLRAEASGRYRSPMDVVLVHSSDLHVDEDRGDGTAGLRRVLATARALPVDIVLLAGDTFENSQLGSAVLDRAAQLFAEAGLPVVILPGNHDPALADSVFVRGGLAELPNVSVLGITHDEAVPFPELDLEIWGHAHRDYFSMAPLRGPRPRSTRWQVAMAHGHYEPPETRVNPLRPSWVFGDEEIAATAADYLALGHWDRPMRVGNGVVPAYYSGSPDLAGTVNLVRLTAAGEVVVTRERLRDA